MCQLALTMTKRQVSSSPLLFFIPEENIMLQLSWIHGGVCSIVIKYRPSVVAFWDLNLTSDLNSSSGEMGSVM